MTRRESRRQHGSAAASAAAMPTGAPGRRSPVARDYPGTADQLPAASRQVNLRALVREGAQAVADYVGRLSPIQGRGVLRAIQQLAPDVATAARALLGSKQSSPDLFGGVLEAPASLPAGGAPLPPTTRAQMESSFGANFSSVRLYESPSAAGLGAEAYTQGNNIHFAPGFYAPHTRPGKELLGHELAHVVQQAEGRVATPAQARGGALNADPALEREADELGARAARGEHAGRGTAGGNDTPMTLAPRIAASPGVSTHAPIQAKRRGGTHLPHVPVRVVVSHRVSGKEFKRIAAHQALGYAPKKKGELKWGGIKDDQSIPPGTYTIHVEVRLLRLLRANVRGIGTNRFGHIPGARRRAHRFHRRGADKGSVLAEIRSRYQQALGGNSPASGKHGDQARAALWRSIRDEVLFQHEYIAKLPAAVKRILHEAVDDSQLAPANYEQVFRIAKAIERMPSAQQADYASKISARTTNLDALETALQRYSAEMARRARHDKKRIGVANKLAGLEQVYKNYIKYRDTPELHSKYQAQQGLGAELKDKRRTRLEKQLAIHGFASIATFESFIAKYEKAFEREAANIARDYLERYAGLLYRESQRYKKPREIYHLHQNLAHYRTDYADLVKNQTIVANYRRQAERRRIPGQGHIHPDVSPDAMNAARAKAAKGKTSVVDDIGDLAADYPIFREKGIPVAKRVDKHALATASRPQLKSLLQAHISKRLSDVAKARAELAGNPALIYKMKKLMPHFYARMGITAGSIYDQIIQHKLQSKTITELVKGIAVTVLALALTIVSGGAATPALVAAGAATASFGLSAYMVYEDYTAHVQQQKLANVGLAPEPGTMWLVIAIAGAGIDMIAAAKAVQAIGGAARALHEGGELSTFMVALKKAERESKIDSRVARAAEKAAAAKKGFADAWAAVRTAFAKGRNHLGSATSTLGDLNKREVRRALLDMARAGFKMAREGGKAVYYTAAKFIEEVRLTRAKANAAELTDEDIVELKKLHEQASKLETGQRSPNHTPSPALNNSPYHPDVVSRRIKPPYRPNPAHDPTSRLFNPRKTPEPADAEAVFSSAVRGAQHVWYGRSPSGDIYRYFADGAGGAHFSGIVQLGEVPKDVRQLLGVKHK